MDAATGAAYNGGKKLQPITILSFGYYMPGIFALSFPVNPVDAIAIESKFGQQDISSVIDDTSGYVNARGVGKCYSAILDDDVPCTQEDSVYGVFNYYIKVK